MTHALEDALIGFRALAEELRGRLGVLWRSL